MEHLWLNKKDNDKLILIFNGWGMNETPYKHLSFGDYDILLLSDYRNLDFDLGYFNLNKYSEKYLLCWSMGVYVSGIFKKHINNFDKKIAINGTGSIVDNNYGIPEKIYNATIKFLNEDTKDKFIKNMFDGGKLNPEIIITRDLEGLKEELISIKNLKIETSIDFDKVIVSKFDKIIPPKNQISYWKNKAYTVEIPSTHCPFQEYKSFEEIICN